MSKSVDLKQQTVDTYNKSAKELAEYFSGITSVRKKFIDEVFIKSIVTMPRVLEIGCGDGRDAEYILSKTSSYVGLDISSEMIKLANQRKLSGNFFVADLERDLKEMCSKKNMI